MLYSTQVVYAAVRWDIHVFESGLESPRESIVHCNCGRWLPLCVSRRPPPLGRGTSRVMACQCQGVDRVHTSTHALLCRCSAGCYCYCYWSRGLAESKDTAVPGSVCRPHDHMRIVHTVQGCNSRILGSTMHLDRSVQSNPTCTPPAFDLVRLWSLAHATAESAVPARGRCEATARLSRRCTRKAPRRR